MRRRPVSAVFFDVDFTLIYPGPTFQGEGYAAFCERYGMTVDPARFPQAVRAASSILDAAQDHAYDADIFVCYTRRIIEEMGGSGRGSTNARPRSTTSGPPVSTSSSTTM